MKTAIVVEPQIVSPDVTTYAAVREQLGERAHMSPSAFRQHFRALTGVKPLKYQKQLRLPEGVN